MISKEEAIYLEEFDNLGQLNLQYESDLEDSPTCQFPIEFQCDDDVFSDQLKEYKLFVFDSSTKALFLVVKYLFILLTIYICTAASMKSLVVICIYWILIEHWSRLLKGLVIICKTINNIRKVNPFVLTF